MPLHYDDQQPDDAHSARPPSQRRRQGAAIRPASKNYHSDEHPEVPRVRRASLRLDQIDDIHEQITQVVEEEDDSDETLPLSPSRSTDRMRRVARQDSAYMAALSKQQANGKMPTSPTHRRRQESEPIARMPITPTRRHDSGKVAGLRNERRPSSDKIMVTSARRHPVYEPPPLAHYHSQRRRQPYTKLAYLQDISHNRSVIVVGTLLLVGLLLIPIVVTITSNLSRLHSTTTIYSKSTNSRSSSTGGQSIQPANPYAIVIEPEDTDHPAPPVLATAAYLLDANTGTTLYAHNPFLHLPMLSTTKMMTAILAVEKGNLDQRITINNQMAHDLSQLAADSSLMGIKKGETYTLRQLLYGLILVSGNDAATVIADVIGGSQQNFVAMMNQKAQELGLDNTHYMNPHGLLATGHYSSAHDLAFLGRDFMSIPLLHQISGTKTYEIPASAHNAEHMMINGDQFLWRYPGADGANPGWDGANDFRQVVSVIRNVHELIGVTMNTVNWWTDMRDLMNWGFDNFTWVSPYNADISHPPIPYDYEWNYFVSDKPTNTIPTANQGRYYIYTGFEISGPIMTYFDKNGGLNHFGYPIGMLQIASKTTIQQKFGHATIQCDIVSKKCKVS